MLHYLTVIDNDAKHDNTCYIILQLRDLEMYEHKIFEGNFFQIKGKYNLVIDK